MKVRVNPAKPIYFDKKNHIIRLGNFPTSGKELNYQDDIMIDMFHDLSDFISLEKIYKKYCSAFNIKRSEFENNINYLIKQGFLITDTDYNEIVCDNMLNRQNLYFYMTKNSKVDSSNIKKVKIGILGIGGIGSIVLETLVRAGFVNFCVLDNDVVELSNLIRQITYDKGDVGKYKVDVIKEKMLLINENVNIEKYKTNIRKVEDIPSDFKTVDILISTVDKPYRIIRRIINKFCFNNSIPVIFSGFAEHVGMVGPFVIPNKTACLECIDDKINDDPMNNVLSVPSYGPLCMCVGSFVANEVINYFVKYKKYSLESKTLMVDIINYKIKIIKWNKNNNCKVCGDVK